MTFNEPRPLLFLDLDDVLVLNETYGGYDVAQAFIAGSGETSRDVALDLWEQLVDASACAYLRRLHDEFTPLYVLSTSWWWVLDDGKLRELLVRTGLGFVAENLHADLATPKGARPGVRWDEVKAWLDRHPKYRRWVVLDDHRSGTGLAVGQPGENLPFIVLCSENVGLTGLEYLKLRAAFRLRLAEQGGPIRDNSK